jgi:hypothetical protein
MLQLVLHKCTKLILNEKLVLHFMHFYILHFFLQLVSFYILIQEY